MRATFYTQTIVGAVVVKDFVDVQNPPPLHYHLPLMQAPKVVRMQDEVAWQVPTMRKALFKYVGTVHLGGVPYSHAYLLVSEE